VSPIHDTAVKIPFLYFCGIGWFSGYLPYPTPPQNVEHVISKYIYCYNNANGYSRTSFFAKTFYVHFVPVSDHLAIAFLFRD
jgi:hypothetical protein